MQVHKKWLQVLALFVSAESASLLSAYNHVFPHPTAITLGAVGLLGLVSLYAKEYLAAKNG